MREKVLFEGVEVHLAVFEKVAEEEEILDFFLFYLDLRRDRIRHELAQGYVALAEEIEGCVRFFWALEHGFHVLSQLFLD